MMTERLHALVKLRTVTAVGGIGEKDARVSFVWAVNVDAVDSVRDLGYWRFPEVLSDVSVCVVRLRSGEEHMVAGSLDDVCESLQKGMDRVWQEVPT